MPFAHGEIIWIMGRRHFHTASSKFWIYILICNNWYFPANQRQGNRFANQVLVTIIIWMDRNSRITQHGFRAGCCYNYVFISISNRVTKMPKLSIDFLMDHFFIADSRLRNRTPVHETMPLIYQPFFIQFNKGGKNSTGIPFIHGKPFFFPVTGTTQFF